MRYVYGFWYGALLWLAAGHWSDAAAAIRTVVPEGTAAQRDGTFSVFFLNESDAAARFKPPTNLMVSDRTAQRVGPGDVQQIGAGSFLKGTYRFISDSANAVPPRARRGETHESRSTRARRIESYRPMYALLGANPTDAKIQLSFRYPLLGNTADRALDVAPGIWRRGLYFGYTQRMFWDLARESFPFRDINFMPGLFVDFRTRGAPGQALAKLGLQIGVQHESNGKDGTDSRGLNTIYVEPSAGFALAPGWSVEVSPRLFVYILGQQGNEDIERFRGYTSLRATLRGHRRYHLDINARGNLANGKGSIEIDGAIALGQALGVNLNLHGQIFTGYGESLLDYNISSTRARIGFGISR